MKIDGIGEKIKWKEKFYRDNYVVNCMGFTTLPYEELPLEFLHVERRVYLVYDKKQEEVIGTVDLDCYCSEKQKEESFFCPILIADTLDFTEILPVITENKGQIIYLIADYEHYLLSFLKLPDFSTMFLKNVLIFKNKALMQSYFRSCINAYLPGRIMVKEAADEYERFFRQLHRERILNPLLGREGGILISFCIPTYNRGHRAVELVENFLKTEFDAEIELVISNNGSTENTEGYERIKKLQDTRISYYEFEENQGIIENCCKVLEMAKGAFAVIVSDEDLVNLEAIGYFLYEIYNNTKVSMIHGNTGAAYDYKKRRCLNYQEAIKELKLQTYIGGHFYNKAYLNHFKLLDLFRDLKENVLACTYPQTFLEIAMSCIEGGQVIENPIRIIYQQDSEEYSIFSPKKVLGLPLFASAPERIKQAKGMAEIFSLICDRMKLGFNDRIVCFKILCENYYRLFEYISTVYTEKKVPFFLYYNELLETLDQAIFLIFENYPAVWGDAKNWLIAIDSEARKAFSEYLNGR